MRCARHALADLLVAPRRPLTPPPPALGCASRSLCARSPPSAPRSSRLTPRFALRLPLTPPASCTSRPTATLAALLAARPLTPPPRFSPLRSPLTHHAPRFTRRSPPLSALHALSSRTSRLAITLCPPALHALPPLARFPRRSPPFTLHASPPPAPQAARPAARPAACLARRRALLPLDHGPRSTLHARHFTPLLRSTLHAPGLTLHGRTLHASGSPLHAPCLTLHSPACRPLDNSPPSTLCPTAARSPAGVPGARTLACQGRPVLGPALCLPSSLPAERCSSCCGANRLPPTASRFPPPRFARRAARHAGPHASLATTRCACACWAPGCRRATRTRCALCTALWSIAASAASCPPVPSAGRSASGHACAPSAASLQLRTLPASLPISPSSAAACPPPLSTRRLRRCQRRTAATRPLCAPGPAAAEAALSCTALSSLQVLHAGH
jgi:hypothetical protein